MAHIIVVGNEKGGSGKSTTCMHVATALARMGKRVGALDLDLRQRSFALSISICWPASIRRRAASRARRSMRKWSGAHARCGRKRG